MEKNELFEFCKILKGIKKLTSLKLAFYNTSYFLIFILKNYNY